MRLLDGMAHRKVRVDLVVVATANLAPPHVARVYKVGHYRLGGPLGDTNPLRYVPSSHPWVLGNAHQDVSVVG